MKIIKMLQALAQNRFYWLAYIVGGMGLLLVALFYQYVLEEYPCVVCIQIRLWISLLVVVAAGGLLLRNNRLINLFMQLGIVLAAVGFVERSYLLLGTEKGFIFSDCGFDAGLPAWFAIEQWLPWLYQVEASCGYTPDILFGITMAETLIVLSIALLLLSTSVAIATLVGLFKKG